ncbi:hypothetical protein DRJ16_05135, partial [Candidatus Woesearchaeota archaeon]
MRIILFSILLVLNSIGTAQDRILTIRDFKGLSTKVSSYDIKPEFATEALNVRFTTIGSIKKRYNRSKYNSTSLGDNPVHFVDRVYINGTGYLIIGYDTTLKVGDDSTGTFSDLKTGLTSGLHFQGQVYKDFYYVGNGTDDNIRTDGTSANTTTMGCQVPSSTMTASAVSGSGLEIGDYKYKVTFVYDDYQESNGQATETTVTTTSGNQKVSLADIPTGASGSGVTKRKIYRTQVDGDVYYYLTTIDDNTTTTYEDTTPDSSLGSDTIPTDHDIPPKFKYIRVAKERLFLVPPDSSYVYYTLIEDTISYPDIVPSTNYIPISEDDGDIITGLAIDPTGVLTIFKQNSIRKLFIEGSPEDWSVSESFSPNGCSAPYSIAESPYGIIYLHRSGSRKEIRVFDGQTSKVISERIEPTLANISDTYLENCVGVYHEGKYYLAYTDKSTGATYNNRVLVIDLERDAFSVDKKDIASFCVWKGQGDWSELYSGDSQAGYVYREDSCSQDIYHQTKSDLDSGTYDNCESSGTEQSPEVHLVTADLSSLVGAQVANTLTSNAASSYSGEDDTAWPSGDLKSDILEISAHTLRKLYWTEELGDKGDVTVQIRTG